MCLIHKNKILCLRTGKKKEEASSRKSSIYSISAKDDQKIKKSIERVFRENVGWRGSSKNSPHTKKASRDCLLARLLVKFQFMKI